MNKMKKIFSILLMVVFLVNTFLGSTSKNAFADGTLKTQLRIINLNGDGTIDDNSEFWVNKDIPAAADLTVSGTGVNLQNSKLKITVQKTNSTTRPEFVDSKKATQNERSEDDNNYYMTYTFDQLNGGAKLTFPMPFKFLESANKGDTVTIKEELFDENGGLIDSATKTYVANKQVYTFNETSVFSNSPEHLRELIDSSKPAKNNTLFVNPVNDYTDSDRTKEDGEDTKLITYYNFTVKDVEVADPNLTFEKPKNYKVEVKLPEGVEAYYFPGFDYDKTTNTLTRVVYNPPVYQAVWYSYKELQNASEIGLIFKNKKYNEVINIEAKFTLNAGLENEQKLPDRTLPIKLLKNKLTFAADNWAEIAKYRLNSASDDPIPNKVENGTYTLYDKKLYDKENNDQTDNGLMYISRIANENNGSSLTNPGGGQVMHLWSIEDVLMRDKPVQDEKKIYYKYFQLGKVEKFRSRGGDEARRQQLVDNAINQVNNTPNKLYGIKEDGSKVELASNIKLGQRVDINDATGQYLRLSLEFETPIILDNTALYYYTGAYPSEKEIKKFEDGEYDKIQYYYGTLSIKSERKVNSTTRENAELLNGNSGWAWTGLFLATPKAYINSLGGTGVLPYKADGSYASITFNQAILRGRYGSWGPYLGKPVTNPKMIYLLPAEFKYVETEGIWTNGIDKSKIGKPEVIENFRNTGRTAVIYSLPDMTPTLQDINDTVTIQIKTEASAYAKQGNNQVDGFFTYDNNDVILPWDDSMTYVDELDLDGDGNKQEKFTYRSHNINFIPPLELLMYKNVGLTTDKTQYAEVGDVGEPFYWKVSINNNTISEVTDISFIDTLPFVGDHVITPNKKGEYKARESKFMTPLANSLESVKANEEVLKNFDVYYQLKPQNILETVRDGEWLSAGQVTDFSQVKSIKVMLKPGAKLASKTTVDFYIPSKIPFDTTLTETQTANNSVAISTDKYSYSEANTAKIGVARYTIKGTVFSDFNKDGLMADNEDKLSGYKVELIDKKTGDVAVDVTGQKLETTTDNEGKYTINAYKRGDYFVRFTKLSDEDVLTKSNDKANGNNTTEEIAGTKFVKTADFALSPTNNNIVKNAGFEGTKRDVTVEKVDSQLNQDGSKKYLKGATFELKQNGNVVDTQTTDDNGRAVFKGVKFGSYKLVETKEPNGYKPNTEEKDITVDENGNAKYEIQNELALKSISGTVKWEDTNNQDGKRPEKVTVTLNKTVDGTTTKVKDVEVATPASSADTSNYEFTDLPQYEGGKEITYTVAQNSVDGYTTEVNGFNIVNKYEPAKKTVSGTVKWEDANNQDGKRPEKVTVTLNKTVDGTTTKVKDVEVVTPASSADTSNYEFTDLPQYEGGKEITYTVAQNSVDAYTTKVDGFNIVNTHEVEKTVVEGTKTWNDADDQDGVRPAEITIKLFKNGTEAEVKKVTEADGWKWKFENLDKYYDKGKEVKYTIEEDKVEKYTTEVNGVNVTNTHEPEKTFVEGAKTWDDANNQDGKRPSEITIKLFKNGTEAEVKKVTEADGWKWKFENLDKYYNKGKVVEYTIKEDKVDEYTTEVNGFNVTNKHLPERTIVSGTKTWDDANDQDGKRPNSIKVILNKTVDGVTTKVEVKEVTKQDNWRYAFNLPKYENGKVIEYSIDEEDVPGYTKTINGHNLKNTHIPAPTPQKPKNKLAKTGLAETSTTLLGTMLLALAMLFRRKSTK